ncbi:uncharacterized protein TNIN_393911 [Trichonephila inaurata madagascariensis]|uniref:Mutator-like transposase domain-containing protein n=1 Tax=Trichonephila inaurata madagascariensis TaxID=2747483 RepID=A0A8X6Y7I1_9ARAC|nr:uncharacterized protein TNIN_393911 [Trichonephila inaurata madagascariensis]
MEIVSWSLLVPVQVLKESNFLLGTDVSNNNNSEECWRNRIINLKILMLLNFNSILCCPSWYSTGLLLIEDSRFGLCSYLSLKCSKCSFTKGFPTSEKVGKNNIINMCFVLGLRLVGKGYTAGKKLCSTLCLPFISKFSFRQQEKSILERVSLVAEENMLRAAKEVRKVKHDKSKVISCGVSVDGTLGNVEALNGNLQRLKSPAWVVFPQILDTLISLLRIDFLVGCSLAASLVWLDSGHPGLLLLSPELVSAPQAIRT